MTKSARARALRVSDILDLTKWNKSKEGKGKTLKHVRWIPSENRFNVSDEFLDLKRAAQQREWIYAHCGALPVKTIQFAIIKGALGKTPKRTARLYAHKVQAFLYLNGQFETEQVEWMIEEYNKACDERGREDLKIVTKVFETTVTKDIFEDFWE